MAEQEKTVSPGIVENYICGRLIRKIFVYLNNHNDIEVVSRDVEEVKKYLPPEIKKFFFYDKICITIEIENKKIELTSSPLNLSERYDVD